MSLPIIGQMVALLKNNIFNDQNMILKFISLSLLFIFFDQALLNVDNEQLQRTKRSIVDEIKNATFKLAKIRTTKNNFHDSIIAYLCNSFLVN